MMKRFLFLFLFLVVLTSVYAQEPIQNESEGVLPGDEDVKNFFSNNPLSIAFAIDLILFLGILYVFFYLKKQLEIVSRKAVGLEEEVVVLQKKKKNVEGHAAQKKLEDLKDYIHKALSKGKNKNDLKKKLTSAGWPEEVIDNIINDALSK